MLVCKINLPVSNTHAVMKTLRQLSPILRFLPALACSFQAILCPPKARPRMVRASHLQIDCSLRLFFLVRFFCLHCQIELSVSERLPSIDEISVKISMNEWSHLCTIWQVRFLKLRHMTSHISRSAVMVSWMGAPQKCRLQTIVKKTCFVQIAKFFCRNSCLNVYFQIIK